MWLIVRSEVMSIGTSWIVDFYASKPEAERAFREGSKHNKFALGPYEVPGLTPEIAEALKPALRAAIADTSALSKRLPTWDELLKRVK